MASLYTLFDDVSAEEAERAADQFEHLSVSPGNVVAEEGEQNDCMLFIESGEVTVEAGGFEVTRMIDGAIIGEIGLFAHAVRTATVRTVSQVSLQCLTRSRFLELRNGGNVIAFRIERRAAQQLSQRLRQLITDVQAVALHTPTLHYDGPAPQAGQPSPWSIPVEAVVQLLCRTQGFRDGPRSALHEIAARLKPVRIDTGRAVDATMAILLANGSVDEVTEHGGGRVRLGSLEPGDLGGHLYNDGRGADSTWLATSPIDALLLPATAATSLFYSDDLIGSTWRIALIRSLADRVNQLNGAIALAKLLSPDIEPTPAKPLISSALADAQTPTPAPLGKKH